MLTYIHSFIHTYIHSFIQTFIHTCKHSYMHTYKHTNTHTHLNISMCAYIQIHTHLQISLHHTPKYTHSRSEFAKPLCVVDFYPGPGPLGPSGSHFSSTKPMTGEESLGCRMLRIALQSFWFVPRVASCACPGQMEELGFSCEGVFGRNLGGGGRPKGRE